MPKSIEVVGQDLHHLSTLFEMRGAIVGPSVRFAKSMRQLVFYNIGPESEHCIENRSGHRAESVARHFVLIDIHASHGG